VSINKLVLGFLKILKSYTAIAITEFQEFRAPKLFIFAATHRCPKAADSWQTFPGYVPVYRPAEYILQDVDYVNTDGRFAWHTPL